jgi:Tfp pilus assembly major pilin PilA
MRVASSGIVLESQSNKERVMKKQQGMTLIGWVIVLALIAFFATMAMRLIPMYQEYYGVLQIMDTMKVELKNNKLSKNQTELLLVKKFDTGYIKSVDTRKNVQILRGKNTPYITKIVIDYEVREPFMFQIDFIGHFVTQIDVEN